MKYPTKTFTFEMTFDDGEDYVAGCPESMTVTKTFTIEDASTWSDILAEFCDFMACCYGYDIREKIVLDTWVKSERFRWLPDEVVSEEE